MNPPDYPKRLIEVDLPIKRISEHARREKSIRHGHITTLHIWWAHRPFAKSEKMKYDLMRCSTFV
jgi:putative DNA methylase